MTDTITLTAEELKELFQPMFELATKKDKLVIQLRGVIEELNETIQDLKCVIEERDETISALTKIAGRGRVVPGVPGLGKSGIGSDPPWRYGIPEPS